MGGAVSGLTNAVTGISHGIGNALEGVEQAPVDIYNGITGNNAGGMFPGYGQQQPQQQQSSGKSNAPIYNIGQPNTQNTISNYGGGMVPPGDNSNNGFQNNYGQGGQMPNQLMSGKGGNYQNTVTSGQPIMGQPNQYMNTVHSGGKGGNSQPMSQPIGGGGGKGGQPSASQNVSNGKG